MDKLAANIETLATQRILKMIDQSKKRCEKAYDFPELKKLHLETLTKFSQGNIDGKELSNVENFVRETAQRLKISQSHQNLLRGFKRVKQKLSDELAMI